MRPSAKNADNGIAAPLEGHIFNNGLGASSIDSWAGVGDLPVGLIQSWGTDMSEGTSDDWFLSDYIMIWIGNPSYTRPTDAHFIFSPDGETLLVQTIDGTGEHLYAVNLSTLDARLVQVPGVALNEAWMFPAWRK